LKKVEIIPIAQRKARKRRIKEEWILETVSTPSQVVEGYGGRKFAQSIKRIRGKEYLLRVVYEETEVLITIVTAYISSQISRYWQEES
tara:strand:+ start:119 stop:382 length:264 start_codon:yes stop_codon:yes gene_type:complete